MVCPQAALYAAAKAGGIRLTKSAALAYAARVCASMALVAGAFETPMFEDGVILVSGGKPEGRAEVARRYSEMIAAGRIGRPKRRPKRRCGCAPMPLRT